MKQNTVQFIGARDCKYTLKGQNLAEMRRVELRKIAGVLKVSVDGTKNDLLHRIINRLGAIGAQPELTL